MYLERKHVFKTPVRHLNSSAVSSMAPAPAKSEINPVDEGTTTQKGKDRLPGLSSFVEFFALSYSRIFPVCNDQAGGFNLKNLRNVTMAA